MAPSRVFAYKSLIYVPNRAKLSTLIQKGSLHKLYKFHRNYARELTNFAIFLRFVDRKSQIWTYHHEIGHSGTLSCAKFHVRDVPSNDFSDKPQNGQLSKFNTGSVVGTIIITDLVLTGA